MAHRRRALKKVNWQPETKDDLKPTAAVPLRPDVGSGATLLRLRQAAQRHELQTAQSIAKVLNPSVEEVVETSHEGRSHTCEPGVRCFV